jgi:hypothetical protein
MDGWKAAWGNLADRDLAYRSSFANIYNFEATDQDLKVVITGKKHI